MAFKKDFSSGTKYYYAVIHRINYGRNVLNSDFEIGHVIEVVLKIRDYEDSKFEEIESDLSYTIPEKRWVNQPIMASVPKIDPDSGEEVKGADGEVIMEEVETGFEAVFDDSYQNPLAIDKMNTENQNIVKLCYEWLHSNIELFHDFEPA